MAKHLIYLIIMLSTSVSFAGNGGNGGNAGNAGNGGAGIFLDGQKGNESEKGNNGKQIDCSKESCINK